MMKKFEDEDVFANRVCAILEAHSECDDEKENGPHGCFDRLTYCTLRDDLNEMIRDFRAVQPSPVMIASGAIPPGSNLLREVASAASEAADEAESDPQFEDMMRDSDDSAAMLSICDDFLTVALLHFETYGERLTADAANFANLGITYATFLADSIGQAKLSPTRSAKSLAVQKRSNDVMRKIANRPRIHLPQHMKAN